MVVCLSLIAVTYSVINGYLYMVILVINNKKCLTLNLSKEPNFILIFL